jgi:phytoene dehydrogenase-like protein
LQFGSLKSITFHELLDKHFKDYKLKAMLSLPLICNAGLPAKQISAVTGTLIYKEFMFDGGYYPNGSMQSFADILLKRFKEFNGDIYSPHLVKKIKVNNRKVEGVTIDKKELISAKYVISNADATQTFLTLLGIENIGDKAVNSIKSMVPSLSAFIIYLGTDGKIKDLPEDTAIWYLPYYDIDKIYNLTIQGKIDKLDWFLLRLSSKKNLMMLINVPFKDENYWNTNKERITNLFIKKMENFIPNLSSHSIYKDSATPYTLYKRTLNYQGAAFGWARTPSQFAVTGLTQVTSINNLYLTGHWTTVAQGISGVSYMGRSTANLILEKEKLL